MVQAWSRREIERQQFLQAQMQGVYDKLEELGVGDGFIYELAVEALESLARLKFKGSAAQQEYEIDTKVSSAVFWNNDLLPRFQKFSRAPEELAHVIGTFVERHLFVDIFSEVQGELTRKEMEDPQTIFHAESSTAEVQLES